MALKRPNVISFSKKNTVRPFEDASSLEFWSQKNDATYFVVGQSTKKRPNGLTLARTFDGKVLDMCELGVDSFVSMDHFKVRFAIYVCRLLCYAWLTHMFDARHQNQHRVINQCSTLPLNYSTLILVTSKSNPS